MTLHPSYIFLTGSTDDNVQRQKDFDEETTYRKKILPVYNLVEIGSRTHDTINESILIFLLL